MAATMNERVHENRNENLHGRKKVNSSFRADKTPAEKGYEFRGAINGQLKGFMVGTMNPFIVVRSPLAALAGAVASQGEKAGHNSSSRGS